MSELGELQLLNGIAVERGPDEENENDKNHVIDELDEEEGTYDDV